MVTSPRFAGTYPRLWLCLIGMISFLLSLQKANAQADFLSSAVQQLYQYKRYALNEKIYLHVAQESFVCGEVLWFKVYCVEGTNHTLSNLNTVVYVELLSRDKTPVMQAKVAMTDGKGSGSFLLPFMLPTDRYSIRAYANSMKNYSPDFYFEKPVAIVNTFTGYEEKLAATSPDPAFDLQFFPEGGNLVNGLEGKVGFKITDETGQGIEASGEVIDGSGKAVATFQTHKFGMGDFNLTPTLAGTYTARVKTKTGKQFTRELPAVMTQGYVLRLEEAGSNALRLRVQRSPNQSSTNPDRVYLLGHTRQKVTALETLGFSAAGEAVFTVDKSTLPEGVTHFTVFDRTRKPVGERLYFTPAERKVQFLVSTPQQVYGPREKVSLTLASQAVGPTPLSTTHGSLAVYLQDASAPEVMGDIRSYYLLESEVKGTVENPAYYFSSTAKDVALAADHLMLTQGWSRFTWDHVFSQKYAANSFLAEYEGHMIRGKIVNKATGSPAGGITTYLAIPSRYPRFYKNVSKPDGRVEYQAWHFDSSGEIILQTDYQKDKGYTFTVENPFSEAYSSTGVPALSLTNPWKEALAQRHVQVQVQNAFAGKYMKRFQNAYHDTIPFYDTPHHRYLLDNYTRFPTMEEVMREYVEGLRVRKRKDGFHFYMYEKGSRRMYRKDPLVVVDGVPVFDVDKIMAMDPKKVKWIEVIGNELKYLGDTYQGLVSYGTYNANAEGLALDPDALVMQYDGMQPQREFYEPKYHTPAQQKSRVADLRHLLHWAPDFQIEKGNKQTIEFFTSDQPGTYKVVVEGLSKEGIAGSAVYTFQVKGAL